MKQLTLLPGLDKLRQPESFTELTLVPGDLCAIVGNTGSGKSRLIKDIEQFVHGDSITGRRILLDDQPVPFEKRLSLSTELVSHLSQNMRFVLDLSVREFLMLHCKCRGQLEQNPEMILTMANTITPEPITMTMNLNLLSGGQSRALMIADIVRTCDSPIILIDEIENAGIDKKQALKLLTDSKKLVLIVTHDPHTALMADRRIIMQNGAIVKVMARSENECHLFKKLDTIYEEQMVLQAHLRKGEFLI